MTKQYIQSISKSLIFGIVILVVMLLISLIARQYEFKNAVGAPNLEASYHVLLTVVALSRSSILNHWLLPTVSLGRDLDKYIPWGATVPTRTGDYIYTSFTSPGFLAPYTWFKIFNQEPTEESLAWFNFFLSSATVLILFSFLFSVLKFNKCNTSNAVLCALGGVSIAIFSRESLLSNGIIYWSQSLYQFLFTITIFLFFKIIALQDSKKINFYTVAITIMSFIGAVTEWTGFIFNLGLAVILWLNRKKDNQHQNLSIYIIAATLLAGLTIFFHYGLAVGFEPTKNALLGRFIARNTSNGSLIELFQGYILSYGTFLIVTIFSFIQVRMNLFRKHQKSPQHQVIFLLILAACIPLLENILMLQHATVFSFDRLKFIVPSSIVIALFLSTTKVESKTRFFMVALLTISCFIGFRTYKENLQNFSSWQIIHAQNERILTSTIQDKDAECAVYYSNINVRGYANLLFQKGIYEHQPVEAGYDLMVSRQACASIFIQGKQVFSDLPHYEKVIITKIDGTIKIIPGEN